MTAAKLVFCAGVAGLSMSACTARNVDLQIGNSVRDEATASASRGERRIALRSAPPRYAAERGTPASA